jgi:hypothetical protein
MNTNGFSRLGLALADLVEIFGLGAFGRLALHQFAAAARPRNAGNGRTDRLDRSSRSNKRLALCT